MTNKEENEVVVICGNCDEETKHVGKAQSSDLFYCKKCRTIWDLDKENKEMVNVSRILHDFKEKNVAG